MKPGPCEEDLEAAHRRTATGVTVVTLQVATYPTMISISYFAQYYDSRCSEVVQCIALNFSLVFVKVAPKLQVWCLCNFYSNPLSVCMSVT